jgi:arginyl-tRNA synthetase
MFPSAWERTEGAFSTRKGNMVKLRTCHRRLRQDLRHHLREESDLEDKRTVARQVGVGALVWNSLYNGRIKDVVFDWTRCSISTAKPSVRAVYARAGVSVLRKANYAPVRRITPC